MIKSYFCSKLFVFSNLTRIQANLNFFKHQGVSIGMSPIRNVNYKKMQEK